MRVTSMVPVNSLYALGLYALKYRLHGKQRVSFWVDIVSIAIWFWWLAFLRKEQITGTGHAITDVCPSFICTVQRGKCIIPCCIGCVKYHNSLHCLIFKVTHLQMHRFAELLLWAWTPSSLEDNLNPRCFMTNEQPVMMFSQNYCGVLSLEHM